MPIAGEKGYHQDDWESVQFRIGPDGEVDERASSHHGYNYFLSDTQLDLATPASSPTTAGGRRPTSCFVSGGSHAGNAAGLADTDRYIPGRRVHLVPLEPIAADSTADFAISPLG